MKTEPTEKEKIIKGLEIKIRDCNDGLGEVSWAYEEGILISKRDAIDLVKLLKSSPKIKQLEWFRYRDGSQISETPIGNFYMDSPDIGKIRVDLMETFCGYFDSADEAKRQAQNIFERRIKECLL